MKPVVTQVDAFTDMPFTGNPAAVCILPYYPADQWMQNVAKEMNLSETAFLVQQVDGFNLRWFTPAIEVDLCGHATLASAHVIWESGYSGIHEQIRFHTRSGLLTADQRKGWIELNFPATVETPVTISPPHLLEALDVRAVYVGKNIYDYIVEVESEDVVRGIRPNYSLLMEVSTRGVIVTSRADSPAYDFVSRFFAPQVGVNEDPVTGSAHCCLGPYWGSRLHREELVGYQASTRGGIVRTRMSGERVYLGGQAVTVMRGELITPLSENNKG